MGESVFSPPDHSVWWSWQQLGDVGTPQKKGSVPFQLTVAPAHLVLIAISTDGRLFSGLLGSSLWSSSQ